MPVKIKPASVIEARLGIEPNGKVHRWFTNTCALHMDKYVPWDTGALAETVVTNGITTRNVTEDEITYAQDYAKIVYYGIRDGKPLNYQTDVHEQAGSYWDKRMWSAERNEVVKEVQNYFDKFGGK
jgi:hypothetical protein